MAFDPSRIDDDQCGEGHLDEVPIYDVLMAVQRSQATGRLTIQEAAGENHMYFMRGQPVGVELAEMLHPLGQLLLELGRINGAAYVKAQRLISEAQRLPGQVFKELGVLDESSLKEVLSIQARKKAEHFCRFGGRPFTFCRGLSFLSGFNSTPLDIHAVIFLAVRQQMGPESREAWLDAARHQEVSAEGFGEMPLPAPPAVYNFGPPEERFLVRLAAGFESLERLAETGTLPRDEMAVLLRYLQLLGRLQMRPAPKAPATVDNAALASSTEEDVFSTARPPRVQAERTDPSRDAGDIHDIPTELPPVAKPAPPEAPPRRAVPEPLPAPLPAVEPLPAAPSRAPAPVETAPSPPPRPAAKAAPKRVESLLQTEPPRPAAPSPAPLPTERGGVTFPSEKTLEEEPKKKKKRTRRSEPEPSRGSVAVSVPKKEKTTLSPLPSIVIEDE